MAATGKSKAKKDSGSRARNADKGKAGTASSRAAADTRRKAAPAKGSKASGSRAEPKAASRGKRAPEAKAKKPGAASRPAAAEHRESGRKPAAAKTRAGASKSRAAAPKAKAKARGPKASGADAQFLRKYRNKLSQATMRAKWISSPEEQAGRPGQTLATRNHDVIRKWAEERGGVPATVPSTRHEGRAGVLRINFPGFGGDRLEEIGWDEWFEPFDERDLVFVYQERMKAGNQSNFFRIDNPNREDA